MATVPRRAIRAQGFAHSVSNVQRPVAELRRAGPSATGPPRTALTKPHGPPPPLVAALVLRRPERRTEEQRAHLKLLRGDDAIATAVDLGEVFLVMLRRREGERLAAWLDKAEASDVEEAKRFAGGFRAGRDAVQAGLTLRHSNGQTEGPINRLKLVKRQGYGRAKVDLLRKRLLRAV
jgi:transposase